MNQGDSIDERVIELIATGVVRALRDELAEISAGLGHTRAAESARTVDDVAERLDVPRSTVGAHWREWGGYKLRAGEKAVIRFSASGLPSHSASSAVPSATGLDPRSRGARARRRPILPAAASPC